MGTSFKKNQQSKTFVIKGGNQRKGRKTVFGEVSLQSMSLQWPDLMKSRLSPWEQWICRTSMSLLRGLNAEIQLWHYHGFLLWFIEKYCGYIWKADGWLHATGFFQSLGTLSSVTTGLFIQHSIVTSGEGQDTNYIFSSFQGLLSQSWMWSLFSLKLPVAWQEGRRSLYHIMKGS